MKTIKTASVIPKWDLSSRSVNAHQANDYIFNQTNLMNYETCAIQGLSYIHRAVNRANQVYSGGVANELASEFSTIDMEHPLSSFDEVLAEVDQLYLQHAVYFHHPRYVAHLNCPVAYPAVIAEQLLSAVNSSLDTFDQSGGATLIEQKLIDWTCARLNLGEQSDGIFTSGGSQSNLMALLMARDHYAKTFQQHDIRESGLPSNSHQYRIFTSEISHFSVQKSAALLGLGHQAVVPVKTDSHFRMDMTTLQSALEQAIEQGKCPIAVVATAGTTDFGSIDPLPQIAALCQQYNIWFHVDAAYGCGLINSQQHRHKLTGIQLADSVTVDYHKSFLQPVSSSAFLLKNKQHFSLITHHADYLNPLTSDASLTPNLVDKSLQTTRRFDALKLWMTLRSMGSEGIGQVFDTVMDTAQQTYQLLQQDEEFEVIHQPEISTVVFRYLDPGLSDETLNSINSNIKDVLFEQGNCAIARTRFKHIQYLKFTLLNPETQLQHIEEILSDIKASAYLQTSALQNRELTHD